MSLEAHRSPLRFLIVAVARQIVRHPYASLSVTVHAALLALLYCFGSYQENLRQHEADQAEVASSLRATSVASTAKRLQDLQTIKTLLEKSADPVEPPAEQPSPATATEPPKTPEQMVKRARELSKSIDALDEKIKAKELATLTGEPKPPKPVEAPTAAPQQAPVASGNAPAPVTPEAAAKEIAALEDKARATLAKRQQRMAAKANGVQVEGSKPGSGVEGAGSNSAAAKPKGRASDASALAQITDFMGTGTPIEQTTRSTRYSGTDFFDHGKGQIPAVNASNMVRGSGRIFGEGGEYANRVYLNSWYIIGPFPGRHEAGLFDNPSYPPEKAVLLDAVYYGKDKRVLRWRYVTAQSYPLVPPDMVEDSVYYGYTEVFVDQARDLTAWIGADDDVQIYLNDHLVWKGGNVNKQSYFDAVFDDSTTYLRDYNRTEGRRVLHFDKGRNKLFFKLSNGPNAAFLSMVLTP